MITLQRFNVWGLAWCLTASASGADTLRVTTWNLQPPTNAAATGPIRLPEAAAVLKALDPDVILLQQVRDWKMCAGLARALKPANYNVLLCSAFRDARTGGLSSQQVAILAKQPAYFSWSQPWEARAEPAAPGGFAFAAIRVHGQRLGFYSVAPGGHAAFVPQWLAQVASVRNWASNRLHAFVVGATFDTGSTQPEALRLIQAAGFADVFEGAPAGRRITLPRDGGQPGATADYLFTQPPGCSLSPGILSSAFAAHYPVTCDLELDPVKIAAAWAAQSEAMASKTVLPTATPEPPASPQPTAPGSVSQASGIASRQLAALALGGVLALIATVWIFARRSRKRSRAPQRLLSARAEVGTGALSSYTVVVGTQSGTSPSVQAAGAETPPQPPIFIEAPGATQTHAEILRQRALAAEQRADQATAALRKGLLPHLRQWLKQKLVRKLIADRTQLMETQQEATLKAMEVEKRLARIELQIQQQSRGYQDRIETLTRELIAAKDENRDLIRAQIRQVKAEMEAARARLLAQK